jgi:hypothetical protein
MNGEKRNLTHNAVSSVKFDNEAGNAPLTLFPVKFKEVNLIN